MKLAITVSPEMVTLVGFGPCGPVEVPHDCVVFGFTELDSTTPLGFYQPGCDLDTLQHVPLVLIVARAACDRLFDERPTGQQAWHLPEALAVLARSIVSCEAAGAARDTLRLARSIELLCQVHAAIADGNLIPSGTERSLTRRDVGRIETARCAIDQRWHEKLTIADLARTAGINRDKLVRGFRELYGATIADVLAERRLSEARRLLLASDLPVGTVAYRCSYLNNASFTRAFSRRFGIAPSALRRMGVAA